MKYKVKYQDGGEEQDQNDNGASQFNGYVDQLIANQNSSQDFATPTEQQPEESDYIKNLRSYDEDNQNPNDFITKKFSDLEDLLNKRLSALENIAKEINPFDTKDEELDFVNEKYNTANTSVPYTDFAGIFKNEGAQTGQTTNLHSSAMGRGQMIRGTREAMYKRLGIDEKDFQQAEQMFKTNPAFESRVMNAYHQELDSRIPQNIQGQQRKYMIAKGWYTGDPNYPDDKVPGKQAGNKLTAGEYARRATNY